VGKKRLSTAFGKKNEGGQKVIVGERSNQGIAGRRCLKIAQTHAFAGLAGRNGRAGQQNRFVQ
jgi:hypothetical protein